MGTGEGTGDWGELETGKWKIVRNARVLHGKGPKGTTSADSGEFYLLHLFALLWCFSRFFGAACGCFSGLLALLCGFGRGGGLVSFFPWTHRTCTRSKGLIIVDNSIVTYAQLPVPGFHEAPLTASMQAMICVMPSPLLIPYVHDYDIPWTYEFRQEASAATTSSGWKCRGQAGIDGAWRCPTCRSRGGRDDVMGRPVRRSG